MDLATGDVAALQEAASEARKWLFESLLPLWADRGLDPSGGFHDQLDDDGVPIDLPKRCRVQSRQTYVFAEAGRMGWNGPWRHCVEHGLTALRTQFRRPDGFVRSKVDASGAKIDDTADNYDQAFAIFAFAQAHAVGVGRDVESDALALLMRLREQRSHPLGGFQESQPPSTPLRSNPHMHLFEASIAWAEQGLDDFRALATEISRLSQDRFMASPGGVLLEYFDLYWQPLADDRGRIAEPGHQFEWSWLFNRWIRTGGEVDPAIPSRLYAFADRFGVDQTRGVAINEVWTDGSPKDDNARLWPQTERLKAALAMGETSGDWGPAVASWRGLRQYALPTNTGLFRDKMRPDGTFIAEGAFASSLYHITCAISELDRVANTAVA